MKTFLAALFIFAAGAAQAGSIYQGKLDIGTADPAAIALRELHDGMWLVGAQTQIWHLQNTKKNVEVGHVSGYWATRLQGQDTAYGPSIGVNVGAAAAAAVNNLEILVPAVETIVGAFPPFVSKLGDWTSVEIYGGYRPTVSADDHHWIYGVGGKVAIPLSALYAWAAGSNGQKGL